MLLLPYVVLLTPYVILGAPEVVLNIAGPYIELEPRYAGVGANLPREFIVCLLIITKLVNYYYALLNMNEDQENLLNLTRDYNANISELN